LGKQTCRKTKKKIQI